jgi:anhydro-N-acetylmuramic acid kinase
MNDPGPIIGLMSGTSLDGVDMAVCSFGQEDEKWTFQLLHAETIPYDETWRARLSNAHQLATPELETLDREYGKYLAELVNKMCREQGIHPGLIASHGHTVFHAPEKGYTCQIGSGAELAAMTKTSVVYDFRTLDVQKGGQGAPLVPVGDKLLFHEYDACLNLGGFSNISFEWEGRRIAFDICPVNMVLNYLAEFQDMSYDKGGIFGRSGTPDAFLLDKLNSLKYYAVKPPKSLGREWFEACFLPLITETGRSVNDLLATVYLHIRDQIERVSEAYALRNMLVTGGGTHNDYLMELIGKSSGTELIIPDSSIVDFKEAMVFAFLGLLRYRGEVNCYASVTGASEDSVAGVLINSKA